MVSLKKVEIKNYKSIKHTVIYFEDDLTILAGKNEAGKTAILEALEDLNYDKNIREEAIPLYDNNLTPEIIATFILNEKDLEKIKNRFDINGDFYDILNEHKEITVIKKLNKNNKYETEIKIEFGDKSRLLVKMDELKKKRIPQLLKKLKQNIRDFHVEGKEEEIKYLNKKRLGYIFNSLDPNTKKRVHKDFSQLLKDVEEYKKIEHFLSTSEALFKKIIEERLDKELLPNFILFRYFKDILPNEISVGKASGNEIIKDLAKICGLDFSKIQENNTSPEERKLAIEKANEKFQQEYKKFWTQDDTKLVFWVDGSELYFRIKEDDWYYPLDTRSEGRRWHLSFYIKIIAQARKGVDNIILIDEPGLYLHPKAQKDIFATLRECSKRNQVIYTTHSPYLIPANELEKVRLVVKEKKEGTKVMKITAKADMETLTPILTAIGDDISAGIRLDKKNSIIVEGFSDYLWFKAFKKLLNIKEDLSFIPSVGADKIVYIASILMGWGVDPIVVLDNDKKGRDVGNKKLKKKLNMDDSRIIFVPMHKSEGEIEDLFSEKDKMKYLKDLIDVKKKNNSEKEKSKTIIAKEFLDKVNKGEITKKDLDKETINNFSEVFNELLRIIKKEKESNKISNN